MLRYPPILEYLALKVLITGATGFLGSRVVSQLLDRGHTVRAVVRQAAKTLPREWRDRAEIVQADLEISNSLDCLFAGVDVLIHLAAAMHGTTAEKHTATVLATKRLLEAMRRTGETQHLVLAGSCAVYDFAATRDILSEESPLETNIYDRDFYTVSKIMQEHMTRRFAEESRWILSVLRPGFIYGSGAGLVAGAGLGLGPIFLVVAPLARLRLTHVENCAAAFVDATEKRISGTFNIIDDDRTLAWQYAGRLLRYRLRIPVPYHAGLAIAGLATMVARLLLSAGSRALPGMLELRRYRARFKPLDYNNRRAKAGLGWQSQPIFETGCDVT